MLFSTFGIGTYQFSGSINILHQGKHKSFGHPPIDRRKIYDILSFVQDNEISLLDTSPFYGNVEKEIGNFISKKKKWHIITKFGLFNENDNLSINTDNQKIIQSCNDSLRRLKVDRLDGLLFHVLPPKKQLIENLLTLEKLKKQGKILYWGVSTNNLEFIKYLSEINSEMNNDYFIVEYNRSLFSKQYSLYNYLEKNEKIIPIIRGALANGVLQENFFRKRIEQFQKDDFRKYVSFEKYKNTYQKLHDLKNKFDKENQLSLSQLAILYLINKVKNSNASILLGVKFVSQLKELLAVKKVEISSVKPLLDEIENL